MTAHTADGTREASAAGGLIGGVIAVGVSALLLFMAGLDNQFAVLIVMLPMVGGIVALLWPRNLVGLLVALSLVAVGALFLLIGATGLLYLPSLALLLFGIRSCRRSLRNEHEL